VNGYNTYIFKTLEDFMRKNTDSDSKKVLRVINIYERLNKGEFLTKKGLANQYSVDEKTIQRDFKDIRTYLANESETYLEYNRRKKAYILVRDGHEWLTNKEVMAMCKILLESRAFNKEELTTLINKLLIQTTDTDRKKVHELIKNEEANYIPLKHNEYLMDRIWEMSEFIKEKKISETSRYNVFRILFLSYCLFCGWQ
jgi:predicted DNA-binding transcriptional regulator YafY